jgi:hypothetical protein
MGVVFSGEDIDLGRPVAIKLVRSKDEHPAYRARLLREAQAMAKLEHANVVRVYEVGTVQGRLFVAMELVEGATLSAWLREPRDWRAVIAMFLEIGAGLAAVHHAGLVHRDFKPDNVLVDRDGHARVADFGLARVESAERSPLTQTGALMGTPGYMAPEQMAGEIVDARADQYSFCVALREALGGRPLVDERWRAVPSALRDIVTRGLAYEPDDRFASMDALTGALRTAASSPALRRKPWWIFALAVLAVSGITVAISLLARPKSAVTADAPLVAMTPTDARIALDAPAPLPLDAHVPDDAPRRVRAIHAPADAVVLNIVTPHSKHLPVAQVDDPGHLPVLRRAIRDLGYDGVDLAALDRAPNDVQSELETALKTATGIDRGIASTQLAMVLRRRGDCARALELFRDPENLLGPTKPDPAPLWSSRGSLGFALCKLGEGDHDAYDVALKAWLHGDRDEVSLVVGMAAYERGDKNTAYVEMLNANRSKNPKVQAALKAWLDGFGLSLQ